jgi:hypothetical protein
MRTPPCRPDRQIHNNKHRFEIPRSIPVNIDKQIAPSDKVTSVLRPPLQAFSVPARLGTAIKEWPAAIDQIDVLRAAKKAKANRALFDGRVPSFSPRAVRR